MVDYGLCCSLNQLMMLIVLLCAWLPISSMVSFSHSTMLTQQIESLDGHHHPDQENRVATHA